MSDEERRKKEHELRMHLLQAAGLAEELSGQPTIQYVEPAPAPPPEAVLLTIHEAAVLLKVHPSWLYTNAKKLPFRVKLPTGGVRYDRAGLLRWIERRRG